LAAACGNTSDSASTTPTSEAASQTTTTAAATTDTSGEISPDQIISAVIEAPGGASISVDGDPSDWADIPGVDVTLKPITDEPSVPHDATVKVAHNDEYAYVLFQVQDDRNFNPDNPHLSGAAAIEWAIESGAGEAMGALDADRETSLGLVDIWHWELQCDAGVQAGGAVSGPGNGDGGNDAACNFDDEHATATDKRDDDKTGTAENSLLGVWGHSATAEDADGTWSFEIRRPLTTGDEEDATFVPGGSSLMNVAYWDPDRPDGGTDGWDGDYHVVTAMDGWMQVNWGSETGGSDETGALTQSEAPNTTEAAGEPEVGHTIEAPNASITVDGDASDWADIAPLDVVLQPITGEPALPHDAVIKVAHDDTNAYVLFQVSDDLNWNPENAHLSGAAGVEWQITDGAPEHMGAEDTAREETLGMVDIWHWELDCGSGQASGGAVSGSTEASGNDPACNLDDEYAKSTTNREDDDTATAENSLTGVWTHTATAEDGDGTWTFEFGRPMNTGDPQDAQFAVGGSSFMATAYWDPDRPDGGSEGWDDDYHVVSAYDGWIQVNWM